MIIDFTRTARTRDHTVRASCAALWPTIGRIGMRTGIPNKTSRARRRAVAWERRVWNSCTRVGKFLVAAFPSCLPVHNQMINKNKNKRGTVSSSLESTTQEQERARTHTQAMGDGRGETLVTGTLEEHRNTGTTHRLCAASASGSVWAARFPRLRALFDGKYVA